MKNVNSTGRIVVFTGPRRCGKDTWAKHLTDNYGYKKLAFADLLRETVSMLYDIPLYEFQDDVYKEQHHGNLPNNHTRRQALMYIGTEALRQYDPDIWVKGLERRLDRLDGDDVVITDARFPNEITMLESAGADIRYLSRQIAEDILYESTVDGTMHESESYMVGWKQKFENIPNIVDYNDKEKFNKYIRYTLGIED